MSAGHEAAAAFDAIARDYDRQFTESLIGRAQRDAVWRYASRAFRGKRRIMELNCGTGEDALYLARCGHEVLAFDASKQMIEIAQHRKDIQMPAAPVQFMQLATEELTKLEWKVDGVFSNFSGLNCVVNLEEVAEQLGELTRPHAQLLFCLSARVCIWETMWYLMHGRIQKAIRRWSGSTLAQLEGHSLNVYYPSVRKLRRVFSKHFSLCAVRGVGVFTPPSYVEAWAKRHPAFLRFCEKLDLRVATWPMLRTMGDHVLLHFERVEHKES
jgi:ubiquinone/menaquinone biosynthesis C-methylase UbiE